MFATAKTVREIGGLPDESKLPNDKVQPHLEAGARELKEWIDDYSSFTGEDKEAVIEAECCLAMYFGLPSWNTFFTEQATTLQKEITDMEMQFHNVEDIKQLQEIWWNRAKKRMNKYILESEDKHLILWGVV